METMREQRRYTPVQFKPYTPEEIAERRRTFAEICRQFDEEEKANPLPDNFLDIIKGRDEWNG
jgi:hypothetical protein